MYIFFLMRDGFIYFQFSSRMNDLLPQRHLSLHYPPFYSKGIHGTYKIESICMYYYLYYCTITLSHLLSFQCVYTASECMHILSKLSHLIGAVSYPNGNARSSLTCVPVPSSFPTHSAQFLTLFWHDHWLIVEANVPLNDFCTAARIHPSPRIKIFMCPRKSFPNFTCRVMLAHLQTI